eukprot:TRINITY_DN968_c0_g2_i7.p1 TRINITY_DN968_c0_g2~~TRINITY_DN968_c0_g2_i7.p1  ORF type:complete len:227 (+),score=22.30 TRINITY_DN968_c0_g2_i7:104-784(+)
MSSTSSIDWILWQLVDSAFPTGSFAHSSGLEIAVQTNFIHDRASLESFIIMQLQQSLHSFVPFVMQSWSENIEEFENADRVCNATLSNHVVSRASKSQGIALLGTVQTSFPEYNILKKKELLAKGLHGHFAPVFGYVCKSLQVPLATSVRMFMFMLVRSLISSAVRLNVIGPIDAQALTHKISIQAEDLIAPTLEAQTAPKLYQTSPILDLQQGSHDRLYSRLFNS